MQSSPLESLLKCVQLLLGRFPFEIFKSLSVGPDGTGLVTWNILLDKIILFSEDSREIKH